MLLLKVVCVCFQIYDEFSRVASKNLRQQFYEALDRHTPSLIQMMKSKRGKVGQSLESFLHQIDTQVMIISHPVSSINSMH